MFVIQTHILIYKFIISMKNIFTILSLSKMKDQIKNVFSRFPVSVIFILIFASLLLSLLHWDFSQISENNILRWIFSSVVWFFFSLWFYIYSESKEVSKFNKNLTQLLPILYTLLFYVFFQNTFDNIDNIIFFLLSITGIIWFLFFAPYVKNILQWNWKQSIYYTYFYNISVIILTSSILGWVLFWLWAIWITAVHQLFDLSWYFTNDIYWDWAIISLWIITPLFALIKIPKKREFTSNYFNENAFFSFLIKYIAIPFIYIYFIILYVYSAKVLMNFWDWPKGEVTWMVIWFSIFGYLIYIFSYIFEEKNNFIKTFRKYFPFAVIPQIFMLFYAIYLRISQYDITINRYFVVVFWIWLLCISLYYALSKKKYLWNITVLLTLFTVIISVWPWSVYQLPESRQLERLKNNLIEANILQENKIIPLDNYSDINKELSKEIYGWINYLCDFNNCDEIKKLFPEITKKIIKEQEDENARNLKMNPSNTYLQDYNSPDKWELTRGISDEIKVKSYYYDENQNSSISLHVKDYNLFPLDITDWKKLYQLDSSLYNSENNTNENIQASLNKEKNIIEFFKKDTKIYELNFSELSENFYQKYKTLGSSELSKEDMTFEVNNKTWNFVLYIRSINIKNPEYNWDNSYYFNLDWMILEK